MRHTGCVGSLQCVFLPPFKTAKFPARRPGGAAVGTTEMSYRAHANHQHWCSGLEKSFCIWVEKHVHLGSLSYDEACSSGRVVLVHLVPRFPCQDKSSLGAGILMAGRPFELLIIPSPRSEAMSPLWVVFLGCSWDAASTVLATAAVLVGLITTGLSR
jgi:hypothetical protein